MCWPSAQWKIIVFIALVLFFIRQNTILGIDLTFTTTTITLAYILLAAWRTHSDWWTNSCPILSLMFIFKYCLLPFSTPTTPSSILMCSSSGVICPSLHQTAQVCTVQKVKVKNWTWMFFISYTSPAAIGALNPPFNATLTEIPHRLLQNGRPDLERALPIWHLSYLFLPY